MNKKNSVIKDIKKVLKVSKKIILYLGIILFITYLLSGIYSIQQNETGVLTILGKVNDINIPSGIHYRIPYPFTKLYRLNVKETKSIQIGYGEVGDLGKLSDDLRYKIIDYRNNSPNIQFLDENKIEKTFITGDNNIIEALVSIQYSIVEPAEYLFNIDEPEELIKNTAESLINKLLNTKIIDDVLIRNTKMEIDLKNDLQEKLNGYSIGVSIVSVIFKSLSIPEGYVASAFKEVKNAEVDKGKIIEQAQKKANQIETTTETEIRRIKDKAETEAEKIKNEAYSYTAMFNEIIDKYGSDKETTSYRFFIETMEEILDNSETYIINEDESIEKYYINPGR